MNSLSLSSRHADELPSKHAIAMALHKHGHKLRLPDRHHDAITQHFDKHGEQAEKIELKADATEIRDHIETLCSQISVTRGEDITHEQRGMESSIEAALTSEELKKFLLHAENRDTFAKQIEIAMEDEPDKLKWLTEAETALQNMLVIVEGMRHVAISEAGDHEHDAIHEAHDEAIKHLMRLRGTVRLGINKCAEFDKNVVQMADYRLPANQPTFDPASHHSPFQDGRSHQPI